MEINLAELNMKIMKLELEVSRFNDNEKTNETNLKSIHDLALLVNTLTTNVNHMLTEQKNQSTRITSLEKKPLESAIYYKRLIIGAIITTSIGVIMATIIAVQATK